MSKGVGLIFFKDGHTEDIMNYHEYSPDYVVFKTLVDDYIFRRFSPKKYKFFKHRYAYDMYGNVDDDYTIADIDKVVIFDNAKEMKNNEMP